MKQFVHMFRQYFLCVGFFSFALNILMLTPPIYMLQVYDRVLLSRSLQTLIMLSIIAVAALLVVGVLDYVRSRVLVAIGAAIDQSVSPSVLQALMQKAAFLEGDGYVSGLRDVAMVKNFITGHGIFALFDAPWAPVYLAVIYLLHPVLFWIALGGAITMLLLAVINEKITHPVLESATEEGRKAGRFIDASLRNAEVVGAMGMISGVTRRWSELNSSVITLQSRASRRAAAVTSISKFIRMSLQMAMLGVGAYFVIHDNFSSGFMIAAMYILARALAPFESAISTWKSFVDARGAYSRLNKLYESLEDGNEAMELPPPVGGLQLDKVVFGLRKVAIIKGVSFQLAPGESLGVIGPSAAGKSTLARLITGVWKPVSGEVRLDGAAIANWRRDQLGMYLGYLPQDVELFSGSVAENIARLSDGAPEVVIQAARMAHAHEMILRLPAGYDTDIGTAGVMLSGGQRQRIALARALYGLPRLVVLDEPNANLDAEGEGALIKAMMQLKAEKITTIVITHKPSLLGSVDKIMVLVNGQMELFGPRDEVLAKVTPPMAPTVVR